MNLLHVISGMDPKLGGVCQAVRTMIGGLAAEGVHNEVASLDAPDSFGEQTDSFSIHTLGPGQGPWCYGHKLIPWLLDNFSRFDAIILHGLWLYHGYALHKALRHFKVQDQEIRLERNLVPKLLVMPHGMLDPYFQRAPGRKLKAWRNWAYWKVIESTVIKEADGILFTCETERRLAHEPFTPYCPQREMVVGLGVEEPPPYTQAMQAAFLAKCPELHNQPYLLFLSRIHEKKGLDLLLNAYANLLQAQGRVEVMPKGFLDPASYREFYLPKLVIAGPGLETSYGHNMQQLVTENQALHASVIFTDMLVGEAKWGAFYGCDAFVLPSHQENFGIAVVEALACSKPVLISNQVNIWREIAEGGAGLVADDTLLGTQKMLARWAILSHKENNVLGKSARQLYLENFAIASATRKILSALT